MASQRLTIFLLRNIGQYDDALAEDLPVSVTGYPLTATSGLDGRFYSRSSFPHPPGWVRYLDSAVQGGIAGIQSATAAGLLLLRIDGDTFALTFGYGRSFLNQNAIERRFGLRVALNLVDERQLRSLDTKVFEEMVVSRNTQTSRKSDLPAFGVDVLRDILRAATGVAREGTGYKNVSGADALVLGTDRSVEDLPDLLRDLKRHYMSAAYRTNFAWVDHLSEVRDPALAESLDEQLLGQLRRRDTSSTHMAMPDNLEWEDIDHFTISPTRKQPYEELDLDTYLAQPQTHASNLTLDLLASRKVAVKFIRAGTADTRWNVYQCLVSEQRVSGSLYALIEGRWFAIADSLVHQVEDYLRGLNLPSTSLPPAWSGETEADYNSRAASGNASLTLLDKRLITIPGAATAIEFSDLLDRDGSIIHVKRKSRSSTLSHLFAQGRVSAAALTEGSVRDLVRAALLAGNPGRDMTPWLDVIPSGSANLDRAASNITFAVVANSPAPGLDWLPFFSKLNLMQALRDLTQLGFTKVSITRVPLVDAPT